MRELMKEEVEEVNGGVLPIVLGVAALDVALIGLTYMIASDSADRYYAEGGGSGGGG